MMELPRIDLLNRLPTSSVHRYAINKMTSPRDLKVAIIGGGMCGLACAVGLVRAGIPVEIFEAAVCSRI